MRRSAHHGRRCVSLAFSNWGETFLEARNFTQLVQPRNSRPSSNIFPEVSARDASAQLSPASFFGSSSIWIGNPTNVASGIYQYKVPGNLSFADELTTPFPFGQMKQAPHESCPKIQSGHPNRSIFSGTSVVGTSQCTEFHQSFRCFSSDPKEKEDIETSGHTVESATENNSTPSAREVSPGSLDARLPAGTSSLAADEERDDGSLNNTVFLEKLLKEMEGPSESSQQSDQFLASLRLRLAQEYVGQGKEEKLGEAERLAHLALKYFHEVNAKEDIAAAVALHVLGSCRAAAGDVPGSLKFLSQALQASKVCRASILGSSKPGKKKQKKQPKSGAPLVRKKGSPPLQPHSDGGLASLLLESERQYEEREGLRRGGEEDEVSTEEATHSSALSLEFSCFMMMGEIREAERDGEGALESYKSAANLARTFPSLHPRDALRMAHFSLANLLAQGGAYLPALDWAKAGALGQPGLPVSLGGGSAGEGGTDEEVEQARIMELLRTVKECRLLTSIHVGLGNITAASEHMKQMRRALVDGGASPLDVAAADVATAEVLLCGAQPLETGELEGEVESEKESAEVEKGDPALTAEEVSEMQREALELLESAARTQEKFLGKYHPASLATFISGAEACLQLEEKEKAAGFCDSALEVLRVLQESGEEEESVNEELLPLQMAQTAVILVNLGRIDEGLKLAHEAEAVLEKHPGKEQDSFGLKLDFASQLLATSNSSTALSLLTETEEKHQALLAKNPSLKLAYLLMRGCTLGEAGQPQDAAETLSKAKSLLSPQIPEEDANSWLKVHVSLVAALMQAGRQAEAQGVEKGLLLEVKRSEGEGSPLYKGVKQRLEELKATVVDRKM